MATPAQPPTTPANPVAAAVLAHFMNMAGKPTEWTPPGGSQDIPHPRTVADIIARTLFIQITTGLAYTLFWQTLDSMLRWSKESTRGLLNLPLPISGPRSDSTSTIVWAIFAVLLPELILLQLGLLVLYTLYPSLLTLLPTQLYRDTPSATVLRQQEAMESKRFIFIQLLFYSVPLYYAGKAYIQRLNMHYHEVTYVGNLGLDHRNGWSVVAGLTCCMGTAVLLFHRLIHPSQGARASESTNPRANLQHHSEHDSIEKESNNNNTQQHQQQQEQQPSTSQPQTPRNTRSTFLHNPLAAAMLALTATIHSLPLGATNRQPPAKLLLQTSWLITLPLALIASILTLPHGQRLALRRSFSSRSSTRDKINVLLVLLRAMLGTVLPWVLICLTVGVQVYSEMREVCDCLDGRPRPWNFRWRVKDVFSRGDSDRVYMGG